MLLSALPRSHKLCSSTASFLATATAARFLAFLPPREAIFLSVASQIRVGAKRTQYVVSAAYQQLPQHLVALFGDAFLGISVSRSLAGTSPRYAPTALLLSKR